ncbi:MAG: nucleotidyltransferase domain-containing protein [Chitinispirillales bacterium]|jgi:predicted nucleotidyltransferase|nr:nucleotidyltransferase domain-containing protein [Chitinispirillales bacterium]
MVKVYNVEEIKSRLTPVFNANGVRSAVLFGSYAKGSATEKSDVDLLVDSGLKGLDFIGLAEYIREALEKEVDVIDVGYVKKGSNIEDEARETGIKIYG